MRAEELRELLAFRLLNTAEGPTAPAESLFKLIEAIPDPIRCDFHGNSTTTALDSEEIARRTAGEEAPATLWARLWNLLITDRVSVPDPQVP